MIRRPTTSGICSALALLAATTVSAVSTDAAKGAYEIIVLRNPFGLKPPIIENPATNPPVVAPSNLELTGISTIWGPKQVFLNIKDPQGKVSFKTLTLGDPAADGIEVLSVDETAGEVRLRNRGLDTLMSFTTHGAKITNAPVQFTPRFQPPQPASMQPTGVGGMPSGFSDPNAGPPRTIPTRSIRVPPATLGTPDGTGGAGAATGFGSQQQPQAQPALSQEAQVILMEIERQRTQQQQQQNPNAIPLPPLPPTPLTPPQQ